MRGQPVDPFLFGGGDAHGLGVGEFLECIYQILPNDRVVFYDVNLKAHLRLAHYVMGLACLLSCGPEN